jgi:hypothetical protein
MARCFRTAGICSAARRASGLPLSACAIAFLMFCVLGLPLKALRKAGNQEKTNERLQFQFVQRAPIRFPLCILLFGVELFGFTNPITVSVAVGMCR